MRGLQWRTVGEWLDFLVGIGLAALTGGFLLLLLLLLVEMAHWRGW